MTGNIAGRRSVLNGIVGVAVAGGLFFGSATTAFADPATDPTTSTATPAPPTAAAAPAKPTALAPSTAPAPTVAVTGGAAAGAAASAAAATAAAGATTQGDVLDQLAEEYAVGSGGGQLSNLLKTSLKLRSMGFKPSKPYLDEIQEAMNHRPNQLPLIGALKDTIAYQQKIAAQMQILQNAQAKGGNGMASGAGSAPGPSNPANVAPQATAPGMPAAAAPPVIVPATP